MIAPRWDHRAEVDRVRGVADMLCTGHADLRDRFARRALLLDLSILGLSTWLVALAFVEPRIGLSLTPFGLEPLVWSGLLGVLTFFLTVLQLKVDWKGRPEAHRRSLESYAEVKREAGYLLASGGDLTEETCRTVFARYDMASATAIAIPESEFLHQKRKHRLKIALSKHLDRYPAASIWLTTMKFWLRDNLRPPQDR